MYDLTFLWNVLSVRFFFLKNFSSYLLRCILININESDFPPLTTYFLVYRSRDESISPAICHCTVLILVSSGQLWKW